jgi:hypothetical protein
VAGQALIPVIVSAREKILDRTKYDTVTASPVEGDENVRSEPQPAATVAG